ncbi:MAG: NAD(P)H:quinone oxidoreductase [Vulcanimicrobiaceae bacterium]
MPNVAVIYYSSTGNTYELAKAVESGAAAAGATVRLRKVRELAPDEAIAANAGWAAHRTQTQSVPEATLDDLEWADAYAFGTPTRYGTISAQLKQFLDTTGGLWFAGKLANKAGTGFSGASSTHGGHESTIQDVQKVLSHWGAIVVPLGYTSPIVFDPANGNPYGASANDPQGGPIPGPVLAAARWQGERLARVANALVAHRAAIAAPPTALVNA